MKIKKWFNVIKRFFIKKMIFINIDLYLKHYTKYLKQQGVDISKDGIKYIDPSVYFDGAGYNLIHIGSNVTISREVMLLTHDYSITTAFCTIDKRIDRHQGEVFFNRPIIIGNDTFIGARVSILGGTTIGNNCIVGACSVVKNNIPDGSIVVGNPAKIIGKTKEYAEKHFINGDYLVEK